ncbi:MAG: YdcF family protein [Xanthobacteraceae bacterium]
MFFEISKVLGWLIYPSNAVALLCVSGVTLWLTGWRRTGRMLAICGVLALLLFGYAPAGNVLMLGLSERFPAWHAGGRDPDGIIVLGGAIEAAKSEARHEIELDSAAERVLAMLQLARRFPNARIIYTGGSANLFPPYIAGAPFAGRLLEEFGVARDRIVIEDSSRTTFENATNVRALVQPQPGQRWLLVTSAWHMPRSIGVFRTMGFDVEAYPVDWRTRGWRDALKPFSKLSMGFAQSDAAMHEWAGLIGYWWSGRIDELLPGPRPATRRDQSWRGKPSR